MFGNSQKDTLPQCSNRVITKSSNTLVVQTLLFPCALREWGRGQIQSEQHKHHCTHSLALLLQFPGRLCVMLTALGMFPRADDPWVRQSCPSVPTLPGCPAELQAIRDPEVQRAAPSEPLYVPHKAFSRHSQLLWANLLWFSRGEATQVPPVSLCLGLRASPGGSHEVAHGGEALQVRAVLVPLQRPQQPLPPPPAQAQDGAHQGNQVLPQQQEDVGGSAEEDQQFGLQQKSIN